MELLERRRRRVVGQSQTGTLIGLVVVAALVASIFYLGNKPAIGTPAEPFFPGQVPGPGELPGQEIFLAACSPCHGVTAAGNPAAGIPALNGAGDAWQLTEDRIAEIILEGTEKMPANDLLARDDVLEVIAFLKTLWTEEQRAAFEAGN